MTPGGVRSAAAGPAGARRSVGRGSRPRVGARDPTRHAHAALTDRRRRAVQCIINFFSCIARCLTLTVRAYLHYIYTVISQKSVCMKVATRALSSARMRVHVLSVRRREPRSSGGFAPSHIILYITLGLKACRPSVAAIDVYRLLRGAHWAS